MFSKSSKASPDPAPAKSPAPTAPAKSAAPSQNASPPQQSSRGSTMPSIISSDLTVMGDLISEGDVQVEGTVKGDINSRSLTVGEGATVEGNLTADLCRICGNVEGSVKAPALALAGTAHVKGDLIHDKLEIEAGAIFEGSVHRLDSAPAGKPAATGVSPTPPPTPSGALKPTDGKAPEVKATTH